MILPPRLISLPADSGLRPVAAALRASAALVLSIVLARSAQAMDIPYDYLVPLTPENAIIGHFSATKKPVLTVPSGAVVRINGGGGGGGAGSRGPGGGPGGNPDDYLAANHIPIKFEDTPALRETAAVLQSPLTTRAPGRSGGHLIVGPIYIEGAEPGDSLEVRILDVTPRIPYGNTGATPGHGGLTLGITTGLASSGSPAVAGLTAPAKKEPTARAASPDSGMSMPRPAGKVTHLDLARNAGVFDKNVEVPLAPFMGVMATCPADSEGPYRSSTEPGAFGGNLDCAELVAGSTLYLPVFQKGGLFYTGDSHAGQGDGEVTGTAIETADALTVQFILHKGKKLEMPRAETPTHYILFGLDPDLNKAMRQAIVETIAFLKEKQGYDILQAYPLASIAVNYHVTQVVDQTLGIHAMVPKKIFINDPDNYWYRARL
jgi:acetamidase/formamidase